jgi:hypothetical protein
MDKQAMENFVKAYLAGNEAAQARTGAYQIADDLGYERGTVEWEAAVAGAAAYLLKGHTFETTRAALDSK